tara:strand:- start:2475 stop:2810 length:336 start_codon:yes stop_codon:yes gene_type:complete
MTRLQRAKFDTYFDGLTALACLVGATLLFFSKMQATEQVTLMGLTMCGGFQVIHCVLGIIKWRSERRKASKNNWFEFLRESLHMYEERHISYLKAKRMAKSNRVNWKRDGF